MKTPNADRQPLYGDEKTRWMVETMEKCLRSGGCGSRQCLRRRVCGWIRGSAAALQMTWTSEPRLDVGHKDRVVQRATPTPIDSGG
jgi:hypothetical protein